MVLFFRNINNDVIEVKTTLFESSVKDKWFALLQNVLKSNVTEYVKTFSLVGNFNKNRTPEIITQQLIEGIDIIKNATWYPEYNLITEPFESLQTEFDRDLLNKLHHHFELLQGQIWNPASYLGKANGKERFAISKLNLCCHELEAYYDSVEQQKNNKGHHTYFYYSIYGTPKWEEITLEDKAQFSRTVGNGMIYLHYAQTGKTWYEAYCDRDEIVHLENITEHRLMSGEFSVHIGPEFEFTMDDEFKKFITDRGFDWNDPSLAIGYCPIGQIESVDGIPIKHYGACQKLLEEYDDFYGLRLDNGEEKYYDYRHNSQNYFDKIYTIMNNWK
jgi:hypothetical protein